VFRTLEERYVIAVEDRTHVKNDGTLQVFQYYCRVSFVAIVFCVNVISK
jgi:hypothetical protein